MLTTLTYGFGVVMLIGSGEFLGDALVSSIYLILRFWWWCVATGAGLGLVIFRLAKSYRPMQAAAFASVLAMPVAVTLIAAMLLDEYMHPKFDTWFIELNGVRLEPPHPVAFALKASLWAMVLSAPLLAMITGYVARRTSSRSGAA